MTSDIVTKIGRAGSLLVDGTEMSRRDFIKIGAAASAVGLAGCANSPRQEIYPNVKGAPDQVPGVAVWFRTTCTECSAGCGIEARTREGRVVKVEGSRLNPINKGGVCAMGQATLQDLYDPDRVREPLMKAKDAAGKTIFKPIDWVEAYEKVAAALADKKSKKAFITGEVTGSLENLISDFSKTHGVQHVVYEPLSATTEAKAAEVVYGAYGIPKYDFAKAEVIVNFGADFLETWISPCEFARGWSQSRKSEKPARVYHIEPRLSLTGANADSWFKCTPGSEALVALGILKVVLEKNTSGSEVVEGCKKLTKSINLDEVAKTSGLKRGQLTTMAEYLLSAENGSLILSGGTSTSTHSGLSLHVITALLNVVLGNVGKTIDIGMMRKPRSDIAGLTAVIEDLSKGNISLLLVDRSNPAFTLPTGLGFDYAAKSAKLVVSFSNKIDETAQYADIIMPASHSLESWGDQIPMDGVYNLIQPAMTPVFNTKSLGDMLIEFAQGMNLADSVGGVKTFKDYVQNSWKKLHAAKNIGGTFDAFWDKSLEEGGYFPAPAKATSQFKVSNAAYDVKAEDIAIDTTEAGDDSLILYPFTSIKSFDGRAANRPWLQETPDPMTQIVWDSWAELHPNTAKKYGLAQGDVVTLRNKYSELNVPVYISDYVHEKIVAVPLGQGHDSFGRYAEKITGANAFSIISPKADSSATSYALLSAGVSVARSRVKTDLVHVDGSKSQLGREIARTKIIDSAEDLNEHSKNGHGAYGEEKAEEKPKQMYEQREHPLYRWGMAIDLAACTGCSACVVACYAENNIYTVGKELARQGRRMAWLRIDRYFEQDEDEELTVHFQPMMCQHCGSAPCEPVCPVYATYHNEEGLNAMVYNRCVGTRYCANNCSYKVRRFNWFEYEMPEPLTWQMNPDVVTRSVGVMEKCTFCIQRISEGKDRAKDQARMVADGDIKPACVQSCPTEALVFGNLNDPNSQVSKLSKHDRGYKVLDEHLNTQPAISYLEDIKYRKI